MFGRLGWAEILIIVVLLLVLFGSHKIPGMMKNLADGINVFKHEMKKTSEKKDKKTAKVEKNSTENVKNVRKTGVLVKKKDKIKK